MNESTQLSELIDKIDAEMDNVGVTVTHWMPLPEPPKEVIL